MSRDYTPPTISDELGRIGPDAALDRNFYAHGLHTEALADIDGIEVAELVNKFGSPLFVFSERKIRQQARLLKDTFTSRYENTSFAWSYKTNYLNAICKIFHQEGWMAEVVSDFEYCKARNIGIEGGEIVFNGPGKSREILQKALAEGALVQVDNWDELGIIEELVEELEEPVNIGMRIWLETGINPTWSKFGFSLENGEAERVAVRIIENPGMKLHTFHTHIGTYILAPEAYHIATEKLVALREQIYTEHNHLVECLNLGGGFPSRSLLHGMLGPAEQAVPPIDAYADAITSVLNRIPESKRPLLRLETGRFLIDESGYLLTRVVAVKGSRSAVNYLSDLSAREYKERLIINEEAKTSYVLDAGVNLLYTATWYQINASPSRRINEPPVPSRLYGSLCMAIDVIRYHIDLPPLNLGDIVTLYPVGAYNVSQEMTFITYRPAVILISENGTPEIIREREKLEDINRPERLPPHLSR